MSSRSRALSLGITVAALAGVAFFSACPGEPAGTGAPVDVLALPKPALHGSVSVEQAMAGRRSVRSYGARPLTLQEIGQVLWAAQGITAAWDGRTAPSAGALYPLEVYLAAGRVEGVSPGVYRYEPKGHRLRRVRGGDLREALGRAALGQRCVTEAPAVVVIGAVYERTARKYGPRARRYVHLEAGCACQNVYLECESLGLGTVAVGAFDDTQVKALLGAEAEPLLLMPLGPKPGG